MISHPGPWEAWRPATCLPDDCFCEAIRGGLVAQPANTLSSLAFILAALWVVLRRSSRPSPPRPALGPVEAGLFAGSLLLVGAGSAFYHSSLTFVGQVFDVSGMYLIATFILLHRLGRKWSLSPVPGVLGFVAANAVLMTAQVTTPSLRRVVFGVLLVSAIALEWKSSPAGRTWLARGAGLMGLAFAIWVVDRQRWICDPENLVQGHAFWHVLGALASTCLYRGYEAEAASRAA